MNRDMQNQRSHCCKEREIRKSFWGILKIWRKEEWEIEKTEGRMF